MQIQGAAIVTPSLNSKVRVCCLSIGDSQGSPWFGFPEKCLVFPRLSSDEIAGWGYFEGHRNDDQCQNFPRETKLLLSITDAFLQNMGEESSISL